MNLQDIHFLYDYDRWANARLLQSASNLTAEEISRPFKSSHGSILNTLAHILLAEWLWLQRWKGNSPRDVSQFKNIPSVEALKTKWNEVEEELRQFLSGLSEESLHHVISYSSMAGDPYSSVLLPLLQHVMNHSTYHRGQVASMFREFGKEALPTDMVMYYREVSH